MSNLPDESRAGQFDPDDEAAGDTPQKGGKPRESVTVHHERRRSRSRRHWRFEVSDESEEWVISYMDMVTLIMCAFVVIAALLDIQSSHTPQPQTGGPRGTPSAGVAAETMQIIPPVVPTIGAGEAGGSEEQGDTPQGQAGTPGNGIAPEDILGRPTALAGGRNTTTTGEGSASAASEAAASDALSGPEVPEATAEEARFAEAWRKAIAEQGLSEQVSITARGRSVVMQIQDKILFASGHDEIESRGLDVIRRLAPLLAHSVGDIRVEGHTDNVPIDNERFASNWELSAGRASTVVHALINAGIPPGRLRATGFADTRPEASNDTDSGRAHNRRVTLIIEN
jgi:chemotaxis protein MotB